MNNDFAWKDKDWGTEVLPTNHNLEDYVVKNLHTRHFEPCETLI